MVMTVLGEVDAATLGLTYMHEHVLACTPGLYDSHPWMWDRDAVLEVGVRKAVAAKENGVSTIVDMTPADFHRDPAMVRDIALRSGVNFIHATGAYWYTTMFFRGRDVEALLKLFVHDINTGMNGTDIRAGILKAGTGADGVTPENKKLLTAVAAAHRATGVPISTHADMSARAGLGQLEVFKAEGVDLGKVVIGHSGDMDNYGYLEEVLSSGVTIGLDRFGLERQWPDEQRVDLLYELIRRGYSDQIVVSHDTCCFGDFGTEEFFAQPRWNWLNIVSNVLPELRERGVAEEHIRKITIDNPRRILG